jgi:hypothetical protein
VVHTGGAPSQPVFWIKGEGIVEKAGLVWTVAGRTFRADDDTFLSGNPQVGDKVAFHGRISPNGSPILYWVVLVTPKIEFDDDDDDNLGCLRFSTAVRQTGPNQIILQNWSGIGLSNGVNVQGDVKFASVIVVAGCAQLNRSFIVTHILVVYQLDTLPVIIRNPGNGNGGGGGDDGGGGGSGGDDDDDDD